ncbi:MAG TPA: hypothetical protein VGM44_22005, partial [Polyangiaceae bacterium]
MSALEELLSQWRSNPDADATVALCSFLGSSPREDLIREVATSAETWHAEDGAVMLAVGRMYLDAAMLAEAQATLVLAGKASGRDAKPFRYLGEVLLRRGDAVRAEKVLARALQFAPTEGEARLWHDRSVVYSALQKRVGVEAVAAEVLRTMPRKNSIPAPTLQGLSSKRFGNEELTKPRAQNPLVFDDATADGGLPRFDSEDVLRISEADLLEDSAPRPAAMVSAAPLKGPTPIARASRAAARQTTLGMGPPGPKLPGSQSRAPANPFAGKAASAAKPAGRAAPAASAYSAAASEDVTRAANLPRQHFDEVITTVTPSPFVAESWPEAASAARPPLPLPSTPPPPRVDRVVEATAFAQQAQLHRSPSSVRSRAVQPPSPTPYAEAGAGQPDPALVLEHLSRVGVYEPGGGAPPAWEAPSRTKTRGTWTLAVASVLLAAAGASAFEYSKKIRAERMQHATALNGEVKKLLETGSVSDLKQTDQKLNESFELDSLSQPAARLWLQNRVLYEVLTGDEVRGIDAAVHRGREVELPEKDVAFGKIASFMAEGDLAGGAGILTHWDKECSRDAYYQLAAGAVL